MSPDLAAEQGAAEDLTGTSGGNGPPEMAGPRLGEQAVIPLQQAAVRGG